MMSWRGNMRGLIILVVVIILFSTVTNNSASAYLNSTNQQTPFDDFDLTITNLTFSKSEPKEGDNITISVNVSNNESFPIPNEEIPIQNLTLTLIRFEENITERKISMEPKTNSTFDFEWKTVGGRQTITAFLSVETTDSNERAPLDEMSKEIWVEPEPIGDVYSPILALAIIFLVVFGSVTIPSIIAFLTDKNSSRKEK